MASDGECSVFLALLREDLLLIPCRYWNALDHWSKDCENLDLKPYSIMETSGNKKTQIKQINN